MRWSKSERDYPKAVWIIGIAVTIFVALMMGSKEGAVAVLFIGGFITWVLAEAAHDW